MSKYKVHYTFWSVVKMRQTAFIFEGKIEGETIKVIPMCGQYSPSLFTDRKVLVTCKKCRHVLRRY